MAFPDDRPDGYDPGLTWKYTTEEWVSVDLPRSGGRYKERLIALSDQGQIWFGEA